MTLHAYENMYCGRLRRGDIVLAEVQSAEERPFLILQDDVLNDGLPTVLAAPLYPLKKGEKSFVVEVVLEDEDNGLGEPYICPLYRVFPLDRRQVVAKKAELRLEKLEEALSALEVVIGRFRDKNNN